MTKLDREIVHIMSRRGSLSKGTLKDLLVKHVYPNKIEWQQFIKVLLMLLGFGFFTIGLVFFFAYNWDSLHKFVKIGIVEIVLIGMMIPVLFTRLSILVKYSLLCASSIMVGVLFAVYGQIYQTGANAYDFFLGWSLFLSLWAFVANFPVLWFIYLVLVQVTYALFLEQVARESDPIGIFLTYFVFNAFVIVAFSIVKKVWGWIEFPKWLEISLGIAACTATTIGISFGIHEPFTPLFGGLILITIVVYGVGIWNSFQTKHVFYLSIIPFSLIIIFSSWGIKISDEQEMFLLISLFIIGSVTATILFIIKTHKRWHHVEE